MPAITLADLNNATIDAAYVAAVANSPTATATDRLGVTRPTLKGAIDTIRAFNNRGAWATGAIYNLKDFSLFGGIWYVAVQTHTASAAFATDAANWRVFQGVISADLAAPGGSAGLGYQPAGAGAVAQTVESTLRKTVFASHYIPAVVNITTTDCTAYFQAAIDATPTNGTINFDLVGTAMIDPQRDKFVTIANGTRRYSCALMFNRPMTVIGRPNCILRVKDFCSAWGLMVSGDGVAAALATSSGVDVKGLVVDCNSDNHYEVDGSGFKWWEQGPTLKRPIDGILIQAVQNAPNIVNSSITNCVVINPLAGVGCRGNMESEFNSAFLTRTRTTGTVEGCVMRNNRVSRHRGNGVLMIAGVTACRSERNRMKNGTYHATRFYSQAVDCESIGDVDYVDCDAVIARYNATDNGYHRTDKAADAQYKIARAGFAAGGAYNYVSNTHTILDCIFKDGRGKFKRLAVNHAVYYADTDIQSSGICSVSPPPGFSVTGMRMDGYFTGLGLSTPAGTLTADRKPQIVMNNQFTNSFAQAINLFGTPNSTVIGNACVGSQTVAGTPHIKTDACPGSFFAENSFSNGDKIGTRQGIQVYGDATGVKLGRNYHDTNISVGNLVSQDAASTPRLPVGSLITLTGYTNGWAASAYKSGIAGFECQITPQQNTGIIQISLRLDATNATTADVITLPAGLAPAQLVSTILIDVVNGARHFCRILNSGLIQVQDIPGTGRPTALWGEIVYACV